jgi:hypothetical protein
MTTRVQLIVRQTPQVTAIILREISLAKERWKSKTGKCERILQRAVDRLDNIHQQNEEYSGRAEQSKMLKHSGKDQ